MTILRDLSILWSLFHILILFMLLYRSRYPRRKTFLLTGICMGPLMVLNVAGLAVYGAEFMGKLYILTCTLPSLLFFWFMSEDKKGRFFFTFCLADTVSLWIISVTNLMDFYLGGQQYVLMPMTYATIFVAMYRQLMLHRKQQGERILQEQKMTLEAQLENQTSIRKMKHDMKGHTATLSGLLAAGKHKEAEEYLAGMEEKMDALWGQFSANPYINATLAYYDRKLEDLSAERRMDIQVGEEELPYMELCRILADGLENVCDALKKIDKDERRVSVHMRYHRDYLLIRIKNRCPDSLHVERGDVVPTSKKEPGHGFGLPAIREAAERLGGDMVCYTENRHFVLDVMVRDCRLQEHGN